MPVLFLFLDKPQLLRRYGVKNEGVGRMWDLKAHARTVAQDREAEAVTATVTPKQNKTSIKTERVKFMLSLCLPQSVCFVVYDYFLCSIQEMNKYYKHKKQEYTAINCTSIKSNQSNTSILF